MKPILTLLAALVLAIPAQAQTISLWNWNPSGAGTAPSLAPTTGNGTLTVINLTTAAAGGSDTSNGGSGDPNRVGTNGALQTTGYPTASAGDGTGGIQVLTSTVGFENIVLSYSLRHSNTSSRFEGVYYTLNGGNSWQLFTSFDGNAGDTWFNRTVDFSSISGVNNNANFGFRITSIFETTAIGSGASSYVPSSSSGNYATTGTWRFDNISLAAVPEPGTMALIGAGLSLLLWRRRRTA